jgi:beta-1,4-mannosyltransferase
VLAEALEAGRQLEALDHRPPTVLAVHPVSRNPFQALIYRRFWEHGIAAIPLHRISDLDELAQLPGLGCRTVLHLHWTTGVLGRAGSAAEARAAAREFFARVDRFTGSGGSLIWTIHNALPHDATLPEVEFELRQGIVDRAAGVHVMTDRTWQAIDGRYDVPRERAFLVPHPSYRGAYPDHVDRLTARHRLHLDVDAVVYVLVGAIKPYKGLSRLLEAFDAVATNEGPPRVLLVAGQPDESAASRDFVNRCRSDPRIRIYERRIPDDEIQLYLRAADVAVLPYEDALNSGVLFLALTFGLPVVAPAVGAMGELVTADIGRTFEPGRPRAIADALLAADELLEPDRRDAVRAAARTVASAHDPDLISDALATAILSRLP